MDFTNLILEYIKLGRRSRDTGNRVTDEQAADILNAMSNWELVNLSSLVLTDDRLNREQEYTG